MPISKKKRLERKLARIKATRNPMYNKVNRPVAFPPMILEPEDFSKDLIDVGDSSYTVPKATSSDISTATTSSAVATNFIPPKFIEKKIPVKVPEQLAKNSLMEKNEASIINKEANTQSTNQLLKQCLSSDIESVVKDNIKINVPKTSPHPPTLNPQNVLYGAGPTGVPRSFLTRPDQRVIEPQLQVMSKADFIPKIQRPTVPHVGATEAKLAPISPNVAQRNSNPHALASRSQSYNNPHAYASGSQVYSNPHAFAGGSQSHNNPHAFAGGSQSHNNPHAFAGGSQTHNNPHAFAGGSQSHDNPHAFAGGSQSHNNPHAFAGGSQSHDNPHAFAGGSQSHDNPHAFASGPQSYDIPPAFARGSQSQSPTRYSPTDLYSELAENRDGGQGGNEDSTPTEQWQPGEKRVSAFDRLGPLAQPKPTKLTINLSFNKEQVVREVVDESASQPPAKKVYVPVHEREDILHSVDETVMKYVRLWPWALNIPVRRTAKSRGYQLASSGSDSKQSVGYSPTAMMMLKEQMDEIYQRNNAFVSVSVTGYPESWTKEDVLDALLENLKGKTFIPCFIEFNEYECKFLVIRCRAALLAIHALDFHIQKDGVQLSIAISQIILSVSQLDFIPRLILRKRLAMVHCDDTKLNISAFTMQPDVSHFIYYPLNQISNQLELMQLQTDIVWCNLTDLDLSHNRLTTLEGFDLDNRMPKLRHLDLSHNWIEKATMLLCCRKLPLRSLRLEGNPLCHDYIDPHHYVTVAKMMFPALRLLDDVPIRLPEEMPAVQRTYCPHGAAVIIDCFLQLFIPLLDSHADDRMLLYNMYAEDAAVTITYRPQFGYDSEFRYPRNLLQMSRVLLDGGRGYADGRPDVEKLLRRWPNFEHDPSTLSVDVMFHDDTSTLFRLDGIVKLPSDSLAKNDQLVAFSRTILLQTVDGFEHQIKNEMIYWDQPTEECAKSAFRRTLVQRKPLSLKIESPPNEDCKEKLMQAFMKLTKLEKMPSLRCLERKEWDLREALEYFMQLYKVDNLQPLMEDS